MKLFIKVKPKGGTQSKQHDRKVEQERPKVESEEQWKTKLEAETGNVTYKNYIMTKAREGIRAE